MHQVCLVLKQVVDGLNDVSFTQHNSIPHVHELVFHFSFKPMHKMYALVKETLEESLLDIALIGKDFPIEYFGENRPYSLVSIIDVSRCETESYDVSAVIAKQMKFEAMTPSHSAFTTLGYPLEYLIKVSPHVMTNGHHCTVYKADA